MTLRLLVFFGLTLGICSAQVVPQTAIADPVSREWVSVSNHAVTVAGVGNSAGATGQQSVTGSAVILASQASKQVCINAISTNNISIYIGFSSSLTTSNGFELKAGAGVCLPIANVNLLYVIASTTGAGVSWVATN